jgi:RecB family endonuclease NucS
LAKNPEKIEKTLRLYATPGNEGVEYPVDHGWIDILTTDAQGGFVVVELKLSRGRQKALGQLLYYMGWVDQHLGTPSNPRCRGIIIAKKITDALVVAVTKVPGVKLYQYKMSFSTELVDAGTVISATGA